MDEATSRALRAVRSGATTLKSVGDATGLSRIKAERALAALEKQRLLVRADEGFSAVGAPPPAPARQCGTCTSCCTLLEVTDVGKSMYEWCKHCDAGKGCNIYDTRPQMCRSFSCGWLQGHVDDNWYPQTAGMVLHFSQDAINVQVDIAHANRWREEPYFSKLSEWSLNGIRANGNSRGYATLIVAGSKKFLLLGRTAVPEPTLFGTAFVPMTTDTFRYWKAQSPEHLQRLNERVAEIHRIRQEFGRCAVPDDDNPQPPYRNDLLLLSDLQSAVT